jgi:DNA-binding phage protein
MAKFKSAFYQDLEKNLKNPEFAAAYNREGLRIKMIDELINQLDDARALEGISKTQLALALQQQPANVRRFFTSKRRNPTISSLIDISLALGYRFKLEPLTKAEKKQTQAA